MNPIFCKECNGNSFDYAHGAWYCEDCGLESIEHGQDFVYNDTCPPFVEPSVGEDSTDYTQYHLIRTTVIFLVLAVLVFGQIFSTIGP